MVTRLACALAGIAALASCKAVGTFACERDEQCRLGANVGACENTGFCSFGDMTCPSGSRYDPLAGAGLGGTCVPDDTPMPDVPPDPRCNSWMPLPELFDPCAIPMPAGDLALTAAASPYTYDTTTAGGALTDKDGTAIAVPSIAFTQAGGVDAALISIETLAMEAGARLVVVGPKPLIIAAWTAIDVDGTIDAGSRRGDRPGAGANPATCTTEQQAPTAGGAAAASGGSGGGGGGAFRGTGGAGGTGDNTVPPAPGGSGGTAAATPAIIRGGCGGAASGTAGGGAQAPSTPTTISEAGAGGGGIRLASRTTAAIDGIIVAGGGGGIGAPQGSACGGGGGGSGGYVGIEAAMSITLGPSAVLAANGGGGGGSGPFAGAGMPGGDGQASANAAPGGPSAGVCGVAGSNGSAGGTLEGGTSTTVDACGGSGGGGGAGFVLVRSPAFTPSTATVSPAAIVTMP